MISLSYFAYDLFIMWKTKTLDFAMGMHHSVCIYIFYIVVLTGTVGNESIKSLFCLEMSNPAMHGRAILKTYGKRYTMIHEVTEHFFIISYSIARMCFYPPILWAATQSGIMLILKLGGWALMFQSCQYVWTMIKILK